MEGIEVKTEDRRLIEDYLPLDVLNAIAAKEKKHPKRPVELIHYWPARRPTTAMRAAIYAALVPAPATNAERQEASSFVAKLASYVPDAKIIEMAAKRIKQVNGGKVPKVLDMFAGGGAIPLESARLSCESHALDYNPVAHLIQLCTLVYPQTFGPKLADEFEHWSQVILERMQRDVGELYPPIRIPETKDVASQMELFGENNQQISQEVEPVAYIWARTVPCRRPGCDAPVPLVRQAWLRKSKNGTVAAIPRIESGSRLCWDIVSGGSTRNVSEQWKQTGAGQAVCVECNTPAPSDHVKEMARAQRMGESLAAVVVQGSRSKLYLSPDYSELISSEKIEKRLNILERELGLDHSDETLISSSVTNLRNYGVEHYRELLTLRQLLVLFTLIKHIRRVHVEMLDEGIDQQRARALLAYFGMAFGRVTNSFTKFCRWQGRDQITIAAIGDRQALKMIYDFSEISVFARTAGCLSFAFENEAFCIRELARISNSSVVTRGNAEKLFYDDETFDAIVTDPPYYSSIFYSDISAFFYVWLKRIVGDLYPEHFALPMPPKRREAVAQPSEHDGNVQMANEHYQNLMRRSFAEARRVLKPGAPLVCVYAHRTTEGWATLIRALVGAGLTVTEAWPVQTEARGRVNALGRAALSDSIFFVARRRNEEKTGKYEIDVEPELHSIASERVVTLWADGKGIGGADLLMAAVGAGLRAYTRFANVEYANGEPMPAELYLREVEGVVLDVMLDEIFGLRSSAVGSVDSITRFYVLWRFTYRESNIEAGDAYVFCYPQGIEIDGSSGLSGPPPSLVEKSNSKFRVRSYEERGDNEELGMGSDGQPAPLIDVLHRMIWLIENRPVELQVFLKAACTNVEQLRLITQALCAPVLNRRPEGKDATTTKEMGMLSKLTANWRSLVEEASLDQEFEWVVREQPNLPYFSEDDL